MSLKRPPGLSLVIGFIAMAFVALPAMASAAPQLTSPPGTTVPIGTTLTATSTNAKTVLGSTILTCEKVAIHGIIKKNSGTEVEVEMESTKVDTATGCKVNGVFPVTIEPTLSGIKLTGSSKTAEFEFVAPGLELVESSKATVTYTGPCAKTIHVAGPVTGSASGTFTGDFTIENTKGEEVCVD